MSQPSLKSPLSQDIHSASFKEVRFSHPLVPVRRARSVASSNPYLDSTYHARAAKKASKENTYRELAVYVDQSRSLLDSQRLHFERERLLFAEERKLWEMERSLLKSRIAELEAAAGRNNAQSYTNQFRPSFSLQGGGVSSTGLWQPNGFLNASRDTQEHHVWEGPLPGSRRPTRVFPREDDFDVVKSTLYLAPTEANGFGFRTSLDAALSPQLFDRTGQISIPVPIEKVDSQLDGITLKSTALPPDVVAKVMTPPTSISPTSSPPKDERDTSKPASEGKSPLKLKLSDLGPPDENLVRNAGHTPMAILGTETEASNLSPNEVTLGEAEMEAEEAPLAPVVTKQPVENGDSYFPVMDVDDDPALKGPLTLENNEGADSAFLLQLDQKLLDEAKKAIGGSFAAEEEVDSEDDTAGGDNEPDPELKLKPSTNFGTAFGQC
jgi:hypothetical protein